jgi:hypothetical protein
VSDLQFVDEGINTKSSGELAKDAIEERERREQEYETDRQSRLQLNIMQKVDELLVGFNASIFRYALNTPKMMMMMITLILLGVMVLYIL